MQIERSNEFGKLPLIELTDFELENNITLPDDYKTFLLEHNGGKPYPNINPDRDIVVAYILGMHNGPFYASLYRAIDVYMTRVPFSSFPIATDPFGNLFLMSIHPEGHGHIYFWDHEGEPEFQDGTYIDNCRFVAYSFSEFVENLRS